MAASGHPDLSASSSPGPAEAVAASSSEPEREPRPHPQPAPRAQQEAPDGQPDRPQPAQRLEHEQGPERRESQTEEQAPGQEAQVSSGEEKRGQEGQESHGQEQEQQQDGERADAASNAEAEAEAAAEAAEALSHAEAVKREGNELFGRGAWVEAAAKYNAALDAAPASAAKERAIYFSNLAACNIKLQEYAAAVQNCTAALELDLSYAKAHMRRCEAFERLDELDHALNDAKALLATDPDNGWAKAKVASLQPKVDERTEKLKAEMLGKLKELGNTILGKFGLSTDNFKFDKDPNTGSYSVRFER